MASGDWSAIILAGGDGTRLRSLTRRLAGDDRPKQFCRILGSETLLEQTRRRVSLLVAPERTLTVVTKPHERFYAPALAGVPRPCVVVQPENRGTAPALLYGLLRLEAVAPSRPVALFPSDHHLSDDHAFMARVSEALQAVHTRPDVVVLLGIAADRPEVEYGWIEPGEPIFGPWLPIFQVRRFWEKPALDVAERLLAMGCLWNSFVIAAHPRTLMSLIQRAVPSLHRAFEPIRSRMGTPWEDGAACRVYARLQSADFSRHVLGPHPDGLAVLPVTGVGWTDLGDPARVQATQHGAWRLVTA
jgi:mannose-1-phosphate guanylyltransferase